MPKNRKFNKKNAFSFKLEHGKNPWLVQPEVVESVEPEETPEEVFKPKETPEEKAARFEEQKKYGIFFTDDTNYLEFLKERSDNFVQWPEHAMAEIEARSREPDFIDVDAAMEEDFEFDDSENELEENFLELAHGLTGSDQVNVTEEMPTSSRFSTLESSKEVDGPAIEDSDIKRSELEENFLEWVQTRNCSDGVQPTEEEILQTSPNGEEEMRICRDEEAISITKQMARRQNLFKTDISEQIIENNPRSIRNTESNQKILSTNIMPQVQCDDVFSINDRLRALALNHHDKMKQVKNGKKRNNMKGMNEAGGNACHLAAELERRHKTSRGKKGCVRQMCKAWQE